MSKKIISILSMLLISVSLVGCSNTSDSSLPNTQQSVSTTETASVLDTIPIDFTTTTADGTYVKADYPSEEWTYSDETILAPFILLYNASTEEFTTNINIGIPSKLPQPLQEFSKTLSDALPDATPGLTVDLSEIRKFDDKEIIYMETHTKLTDEIIDLLIEEGNLTDELLEQIGGRDALKSTPETKQFVMVVEQNGKAVTITGSYLDDSEKEPLLKAMKTVIQTLHIK